MIPTCAVWNKQRKRYFFHGDPPVELVRTGDHNKDIEVNTARFAAAMERMVRLYPGPVALDSQALEDET